MLNYMDHYDQLLSAQNIQISHAKNNIEAMLADDLISQALEISLNDVGTKTHSY